MKSKISKFFGQVNEKYSQKIISIHIAVLILASILFYPLIPILLNYPPYIFENEKVHVIIYKITYLQSYIPIVIVAILAYFIFLKVMLKGIDEWKYLNENNNFTKLNNIRRKCLYIPYYIFIFEIIIPIILLGCLELFYLIFSTPPVVMFVKLSVLLFSYITLYATISFILSKRIYTTILYKTYRDNDLGTKISLKAKIFLQVLPVIIMAILFTSLIGYSRLIDEKGHLLFKIYKNQLEDIFPDSYKAKDIQQVQTSLQRIKFENKNDFSFVVSPDNRTFTSNQSELSKKFLIFMKYLASKFNGNVYEETGEIQGAVIKIQGVNGQWIAGVQYKVSSYGIIIYFIISLIGLLALTVFVLYYFSKTLSDDISLISASLTEIAEGEDIQLENKIAVTSNDEIGDLAIAFNKVQDRERQHIHDIREQQRINMERERLVSLGQMLGGITHNLNSPIISINDYIESMDEVARKMENLPAGDTIASKDYLEMVNELRNNLSEMRPHCFFISDLLTTVRNQAVQLNDSISQSFTIAELQARIRLLMDYELKKHNCILKAEIQLEPYSIMKGEINNLVQVINNLILNAIQAYEDKGGVIELIIEKRDYNKIVFAVRDHAEGIPEEVQQKLFQEMVTTKGPESSGLGLYMSRLTIKGRFGGELIFSSTPGEGSTFYIIIPYDEAE